MNGLILDLRYVLRSLRRSPGFTTVAVVSLTMAIAVNVIVFSISNAILFRSLPVERPQELVRIGLSPRGAAFGPASLAELRDIEASVPALSEVIGHQPREAVVDAGEPSPAWAEIATRNYFDFLGLRPSPGRGFGAEEQVEEVVVSHAFWRARFEGDPGVVGRTIRVNGREMTVVGVAPEGFHGSFMGFDVDLWVPVDLAPEMFFVGADLAARGERFLMLIGRRSPDASDGALEEQLNALAARLETTFPDTNAEMRFTTARGDGAHPFLEAIASRFLAVLMGVVGLVLFVACANVATMIFARGAARSGEIAVRAALGAGRGRVMRLLLLESLVLATLGASGGTLISLGASRVLGSLRLVPSVPIALDFSPDARVLGFAILLAALAALAFGLLPALRSARGDMSGALRRHASGAQTGWIRRFLVTSQVAVSAALLIGASLMARSWLNSRSLDPGFEPDGVWVMEVNPDLVGYTSAESSRIVTQILERTEALAGTRGASAAYFVPLGDRGDQLALLSEDVAGVRVDYNLIRPGFFETLGLPLVRGRDFEPTDDATSQPVAVVNETLAATLWPEGDAVGSTIRVEDRSGAELALVVVGVAADAMQRRWGEARAPFLYIPALQMHRPGTMILARPSEPAAPVVAEMREIARAVAPELGVLARPMGVHTSFSLIPLKVLGWVMTVSGGIGLLLAMGGVFGVVAYTTARRFRELGIRVALGASPDGLRRTVAWQGTSPAIWGVVFGLGLGLLLSRFLRSFLIGLGPLDPSTWLLVSFVLLGTAAGAAYLPARRVGRVDPVSVLREE